MTWPTVKLEEIAEVRLGRQRSPKNHAGTHMQDYLRAANVGWDGLKLDDVKQMNFTDSEMALYSLKPGDLLLTEASGSPGEVGKPALWSGELEECAFQNTLIRVRPRNTDSRYLLHFFSHQARTGAFAAGARGAGINHLGQAALAGWPVPLPPLDEQRRIGSILDQAQQLVVLRDKHLQALLTLREATFLELFGHPATWPSRWVMVTIGDLAESVDYGTSERSTMAGELPVLRMGNISYQGDLDLEDLKYTTLSADSMARYTVRRSDLLFNRTNSPALVGKTAIVDVDRPMAFAGYLIRVRMKEDVRPEFVSGYLNSRHGKALLRGMAKSAVSQANINAKEMCGIRIARPPLDLQQRYVEQLAVLGRHRAKCAADLAVQQTLVETLQARAFSGQL